MTTKNYTLPTSVRDTECPRGCPLTEPPERRYLWWLENFLTVRATTDALRAEALNIYRYLCDTCEHHWHDDPTGYGGIRPPYRQCLWCHTVEDI